MQNKITSYYDSIVRGVYDKRSENSQIKTVGCLGGLLIIMHKIRGLLKTKA